MTVEELIADLSKVDPNKEVLGLSETGHVYKSIIVDDVGYYLWVDFKRFEK